MTGREGALSETVTIVELAMVMTNTVFWAGFEELMMKEHGKKESVI